MSDHDDIPRRRRVLVLDVTQAAAKVSDLVHEGRKLNLPVEPGVRDGRDDRLTPTLLNVPPAGDRQLSRAMHGHGIMVG